MTSLRDIGEFGFIQRISRFFPAQPHIIEHIGDDCAVIRAGDTILLATADLSIEGIHFQRRHASAEDIGWKAAAASLSDIAAMGGKPLFALITLAAPANESVTLLEGIAQGIAAVMGACGCPVAGGDTTRSPGGIALDVIVVGEAPDGRYLTRRGARAGDQLLVTGTLGGSAGGLHALEHGHNAPLLVRSHYRPTPRIAEGQWLLNRPEVHALIDVSDGLAQDAAHLAQESGVGLDIESEHLPVNAALIEYATSQHIDPKELALTGGEDYELALAVAPEKTEALKRDFEAQFGLSLAPTGHFLEPFGGFCVNGQPARIGGFDHFRVRL